MEIAVRDLEYLLNNYWIVKDDNPEFYYKIKNNIDSYKNFVQTKLGSKIIVNNRIIKLEKIPTVVKNYMGIMNFNNTLEYVILFILLTFLEDKPKGEQFILSDLIEHIKTSAINLELNNIPDWDLSSNRRCLVNVMNYLKITKVIIQVEERDVFTDDIKAEGLYETTGLSNYLVREFKNDITKFTNINDFINDEFSGQDDSKGDVRRYKVYRNLVFNLVSYTEDLTEFEIDYLKKFRFNIKEEIEKYTNSSLEVTKNMAILLYDDETKEKFDFPNNKAICDIVLLVNKNISEKTFDNQPNLKEVINLSKEKMVRIIKEVKEENYKYFSKYYKDLLFNNFYEEVINYMLEYDFIRRHSDGFYIYPMVNKINGYINKDEIIKSEQQLELFGGVYE